MTHKIEHLKRKPAKPATKAEMGVRHDALYVAGPVFLI